MARDLKIRPDTIAKGRWVKVNYRSIIPFSGALAALVHYHDKGLAEARQIMDR